MGLEYSSVVDVPREDVFAWYAQPGAFARLSPPWAPMRLVTEASSLSRGSTLTLGSIGDRDR
jgi:ligand-binding SRPBCC domain-containing protein